MLVYAATGCRIEVPLTTGAGAPYSVCTVYIVNVPSGIEALSGDDVGHGDRGHRVGRKYIIALKQHF